MFVAMRVDYHRLRRLTIPHSIITIASLAAVLLGEGYFRSQTLIHLGFIQFQPRNSPSCHSSFLPIIWRSLAVMSRNFTAGLLVPLIFTGIIAGLVCWNRSGTIALLAIFGADFAAGVRMAHIVPLFMRSAGGCPVISEPTYVA